ncbi:MAG: hydroxymethylbilane synthase [Bdellovibrionales bacterium]
MKKQLKIGSRGSPLALAQVALVEAALVKHFPDLECKFVIITTSGDWKPEDGEVRLAERAGGKAQFAKEIEEALLSGAIDCAVHSMKDMDSFLPQGLVIDHMLAREDVRDVLLLSDDHRSKDSSSLDILPHGASIGTVSVRRAAFLKAKRPDLNFVPFRGNVQTRIDKLRAGQVDATLLARAGLNRLGLAHEGDMIFSVDDMLPASGQGAVGIEVREGDDNVIAFFSRISSLNTVFCVKSERAVLKALNGSCHSPIGAYAVIENGQMWLRACVASLDGTVIIHDDIRGHVSTVEQAQTLGREIGLRMKAILPKGILEA